MTENALPLLAIAVPTLGALLIGAFGRWPNVRELITVLTSVTLLGVVLQMLGPVLDPAFWTTSWAAPAYEAIEMLPGVPIAFKVEPLGMIYALIASSLWILNSLYSVGYMRGNHEKHQTRFYMCFAIAIASVMGVAFAGNIFTLFVFYEALSLSTYPLVSHKGTPEAVSSARVYLGILVGTSVGLFLPAIIATYYFTGTLDFQRGGVFLQALADGRLTGPALGVLFFMYMYGIGKAALMPIHRWLPAAMVAPTPVSALLHAVAVVKAGVFSVVKVVIYLFGSASLVSAGQGEWLVFVAGGTIVLASFIALFQDNLKRRLAYSTVSQLSYITLAASLLSPHALMAAALHIAAHAFGKITLFFAAGSIYTAAHKTKVSELDGIGRKMPFTMVAFTIGTLSMIGVPPTAGFISKWYLLQGAWETGYTFVVVVIVLSTMLNAGYFLPIVYRAFFKAPPKVEHHGHLSDADGHFGDQADLAAKTAHGHGHGHGHDHHADHGEAPLPIVVALTCTAAGTILLFFFPDLALGLAEQIRRGLP
ncbi:MAG TPA: monovalent cation/H+ antiporter subunit D family protein [Nannocystaceae bacterium]|nr:monovalent cation/H+ antiporter subunit D family protein [Nannocystaceae bacterium]